MTASIPSKPADNTLKYNEIYEKLVQDEDDLVGMIAYSLYKQNKREWLINKTGTKPTKKQKESYVNTITKYDLARYRDHAEDILADFAYSNIDDKYKELIDSAHESAVKQAAETGFSKIQNMVTAKTGFWPTLAMNTLGALVYSLVLAVLFIIAILFSGGDFLAVFGKS